MKLMLNPDKQEGAASREPHVFLDNIKRSLGPKINRLNFFRDSDTGFADSRERT